MLCVDHARWDQTPEDLRRLALRAPHPRTRERFLALDGITQQSRGATRIAARAGRHPQTVMGWLPCNYPHVAFAMAAPSLMSMKRDHPRHITVLPGGGSEARAR